MSNSNTHTTKEPDLSNRRWYHEPLTWLVFGLPLSAVIAGLTTVVIAVTGADDPVTNYYQKGLAINHTLDARKNAQRQGIKAELWVAKKILTLKLINSDANKIQLRIIHPARKSRDLLLKLQRIGKNRFQVKLAGPIIGPRYLLLSCTAPSCGPSVWELEANQNFPLTTPLWLGTRRTPKITAAPARTPDK